MRILVCGGRDFSDRDAAFSILNHLHRKRGISLIIEGGANGADALASEWADTHGIESVRFQADWKANGKAAGPLRNARMIAEGKPEGVVAFPGGRGTQDMISKAEAAGIPVWRPLG